MTDEQVQAKVDQFLALVPDDDHRQDAARLLDALLAPTEFPVDSLRDAARHLRRPFTPEAIRWKVQTNIGSGENGKPKGAMIVGYIDSRLVYERLNLVCPHLWSEKPIPVSGAQNLLACDLTIDGVTHNDVGQSNKGPSKDLWSDAVKRAAVRFGIGVSVYSLPRIRLWLDDNGTPSKHITARSYQSQGKTKWAVEITDYGEQKLRDGYRKWLEDRGIAAFGDPLDHGDVGDAQGDPDEHMPGATVEQQDDEPTDGQPVWPAGMEPAIDAERADSIMGRIRALGLSLAQVRRVLELVEIPMPKNLTGAKAAELMSGLSLGQAGEVENALDILERENTGGAE